MHELCVKPGPIIVLAPHPDDEALGCGRLLSTLWTAGRAVHLVCLTEALGRPGRLSELWYA
jgi:LmbE family N-acetylglucosaminyl deacetylase